MNLERSDEQRHVITYEPLKDAYYVPARRDDVLSMEQHQQQRLSPGATEKKLITMSSPTSVKLDLPLYPCSQRRKPKSRKSKSESHLRVQGTATKASQHTRSKSHHSYDLANRSSSRSSSQESTTDDEQEVTTSKDRRRASTSNSEPLTKEQTPPTTRRSSSFKSSSSSRPRRKSTCSSELPSIPKTSELGEPHTSSLAPSSSSATHRRSSMSSSSSSSSSRRRSPKSEPTGDDKEWFEFVDMKRVDPETQVPLLAPDTAVESSYCFDHVLLSPSMRSPSHDIEAILGGVPGRSAEKKKNKTILSPRRPSRNPAA